MEYLIHLSILIGIYAILAVSLNLVVGYTGLLSITHAAFFGVGAYVTALLMVNTDINFFVALLAAVAGAACVGAAVGIVLSRFKGDYYALVSFGFNIIVFSIFLNWQSVTRGPLGIPGIPRPSLFGYSLSSNSEFLVLVAIFVAVVYALSWLITRSSFGRVLKAIREDEDALRVFGYRTHHYKLTIFIAAASLAAVAGALFAVYITFIDPSTFTLTESIFILALIIFGGLGSIEGSLVGAVALVLLPEVLRFVGFPGEVAAQMRQAVYGMLLILFMLYRPQGLIGEYKL